MITSDAVARLRLFIARLVQDGVRDGATWREWRKQEANEALAQELFAYERKEGMPAVTTLVRPFFHPDLPLVLLNYTDVAHRTLHMFPGGWTPVLSLCRGIVFDHDTTLVALPYPKFFNHGEAEAGELPDEPFLALKKLDGHLLIIFWYKGHVIATTRGMFTSPSAKLANKLLKKIVRKWKGKLPEHVTLLAEFIHPDTHVIVDYGDRVEFVITGAFDIRTYQDLDYEQLEQLSKELGLPLAEVWQGNNLKDLLALEADKSYRNEEGHVAWFLKSRKRVKIKSMGYISIMIGNKLTHVRVMQLLMSGIFEKKLADLAEEVRVAGDELKAQIMPVLEVRGGKKACWEFLYNVLPADDRTDYKRGICRKFYYWLVETGQLKEEPPAPKPPKTAKRKTPAKKTDSGKKTAAKKGRASKAA